MLTKIANAIPILAFACLVFVFGIQEWQISQHPSSPQKYRETAQENSTKTKPNQKAAKNGTEESIANYTGWLAVLTGLLAFATIGMGAATIGLYVAGERQLRLARDEFLSTHRPKIRIKHFWLGNDIWHGEPITVNLTCVNNGTTEAILGAIGIKYFVIKEGKSLPIEPDIPTIINLSGARLPCGFNWPIKGININRILTPEENADIQQGRFKLYCVGYINYLDASGRMRITGFCRVLTFPQDTLAHAGNCRFRVFDDPDYEYED